MHVGCAMGRMSNGAEVQRFCVQSGDRQEKTDEGTEHELVDVFLINPILPP